MSMALVGIIMAVAFWLYAVIDVLTTEPDDCKVLPKGIWVAIVVLVPKFGGMAWFLIGRPRKDPFDPDARAERIERMRNRMRLNDDAPIDPAQERRRAQREALEEEMFQRRFRQRVEQQRKKTRDEQPD
ncbi:PLD nuclease N-terminal domain-containing protein [Natronoglycomyces albus]|uniref:PLDc_N domain-containing protein n=1 Tax=Natronoglycomyces albus TaxID=2811108 RepID=A0A895XV25_9ACTN|nr:PLD nuclease N-terminal domain-containing protein [Natronoglycomyces albus]QSB05498.1 PLDc_N domain-containing protein [Natronoglycomyces albus]